MVPMTRRKEAGKINCPKRIATNKKAALKLIVKKSLLTKKRKSAIFNMSADRPIKYRTRDRGKISQNTILVHLSFPKNLKNKEI
jgi:hypothetical protein